MTTRNNSIETHGTRKPPGRRVTSADVAERAGLSRATVSYVLNNTPHQVIPEQTRQRVLAAAAELGYMPSAAARALRNGRSDIVLLLLPDWPIGPSVGALLDGLSTAVAQQGLTFVAHPRSAGRPVSDVWKAITPAAVVTFEALGDDEAAELRAAGIELTVALFSGQQVSALDIPEERTGRLQAHHLAVGGHRHLGYAWPDDPRVVSFARPRLEGVRQTCAELGLSEPVVITVPIDLQASADAVQAWHAANPPVTGICAYNDEVALAILGGAHRARIRVPDDLAVIGADDIPAAAVSIPALTTVRADSQAIAHHIADSLASQLQGRPAPSRPGSDIHYVIRRDTA